MSAVHAVVRLLADPENRVSEGGGMLVSSRFLIDMSIHACRFGTTIHPTCSLLEPKTPGRTRP